MSYNHETKIEANLKLLCEILYVSDLLLTELQGKGVIDSETKANILSISNLNKRNNCFLDWLKMRTSEVFTICMDTLRLDNQGHVANLLDGTPGELPLSEEVKQKLRKNIRILSEMINTQSGIVVDLWSCEAISTRDRQNIESLPSESDKAFILLNMIMRKSDRTYYAFLDALKRNGQGHVVEVMTEGTVIEMHAEFQHTASVTSSDLKQFESFLAEKIIAIAKKTKPSEVDETIRKLQEIFSNKIKIIGCKQVQSIVLFVWCKDNEAMAELLLMFETRQFETNLEKIFSTLKTSMETPKVIVRVTMTRDDLLCLKRAAFLLRSETSSSLSSEELQQEICEMKSYVDEVENKMATLETSNKEFQKKTAILESQILAEKLSSEKLKSQNFQLKLELDQTPRTLENYNQKVFAQQKGAALNLDTFNTDVEVFGLAYLNETFYLLSRGFIITHQSQNPYLKSTEDIQIREIQGPCDIAACHRAQCLYISDGIQECVWQVKINAEKQKSSKEDNYSKPFKWLVDIDEPYTLSVSSDGYVLIPRSTATVPRVECYSSRGDLIQTLNLPMGLGHPIHAVKTTAKKYVVSFYSEYKVMDDGWRICEFDEKGEMKIRPEIEDVSYMAPGDGNWVFVANRDFNKIVMCDERFACNILDFRRHSIQFPSKLCYIKGSELQDPRLAFLHETETGFEVSLLTLPKTMSCTLDDW